MAKQPESQIDKFNKKYNKGKTPADDKKKTQATSKSEKKTRKTNDISEIKDLIEDHSQTGDRAMAEEQDNKPAVINKGVEKSNQNEDFKFSIDDLSEGAKAVFEKMMGEKKLWEGVKVTPELIDNLKKKAEEFAAQNQPAGNKEKPRDGKEDGKNNLPIKANNTPAVQNKQEGEIKIIMPQDNKMALANKPKDVEYTPFIEVGELDAEKPQVKEKPAEKEEKAPTAWPQEYHASLSARKDVDKKDYKGEPAQDSISGTYDNTEFVKSAKGSLDASNGSLDSFNALLAAEKKVGNTTLAIGDVKSEDMKAKLIIAGINNDMDFDKSVPKFEDLSNIPDNLKAEYAKAIAAQKERQGEKAKVQSAMDKALAAKDKVDGMKNKGKDAAEPKAAEKPAERPAAKQLDPAVQRKALAARAGTVK